jgi:hypothetical protein
MLGRCAALLMLAIFLASTSGASAQSPAGPAANPPVANPNATAAAPVKVTPAMLAALVAREQAAESAEQDATAKLLANVAAAPAAVWARLLELRRVTDQRQADVTAAAKRLAVEDPVAAAVAASAVLHMRALRGTLDAAHDGDNPRAVVLRGSRDPADDPSDMPDRPSAPSGAPPPRGNKPPPMVPHAPSNAAQMPKEVSAISPWYVLLLPAGMALVYVMRLLYRAYHRDRRFAQRKPYLVGVRLTTDDGMEINGQMLDISWGGMGVRLDDPTMPFRRNAHIKADIGTGAVFACDVIRKRKDILALRFDVLNEDSATDLDTIMALPPGSTLGASVPAA